MVKAWLIASLLAVIMVVALWGCATQAKSAMVSISYDDFQTQKDVVKDITVTNGETVTVKLFSNATTGYQWGENAQISDPAVLEQVDHQYVAPDNAERKMGAGGTEVWSFKTLKSGSSTIYTEYSRPWEKGEKATWTFKLNVMVN